MKIRTVRVCLAMSILGVFAVAGSASAATGVWRVLQPGGNCLDANSSGTVSVGACTSGNNFQQWTGVLIAGSNRFQQKNLATNQCLSIKDVGSSKVVFTTACESVPVGSRQLWDVTVHSVGGSWRQLRNVHTSSCLDSGQSSKLLACNNGVFQAWTR